MTQIANVLLFIGLWTLIYTFDMQAKSAGGVTAHVNLCVLPSL